MRTQYQVAEEGINARAQWGADQEQRHVFQQRLLQRDWREEHLVCE